MNKRLILKPKSDDDDDEEYYDESAGYGLGFGATYQEGYDPNITALNSPSDTGVLDSDGTRILKHPLRIRPGFHPPNRAYYAPTDESPERDHIFGWLYKREEDE